MSEKKAYRIRLQGCDDKTLMLVELTDEEAALVQRLSDLSEEASESGCQPKMSVAAAGSECVHGETIGDECYDCPDCVAVGVTTQHETKD